MVEFRKLISFGKTSFVTSIPKGWVIKHNLKKGDLIAIEEKNDDLVITPRIQRDKEEVLEEATIDIDGLDRTSIMYYIRAVYRKGYDIIKIKFNQQTCVHFRTGKEKRVISIIHEEINRLVGVEIVEQKEKSCLVKSISETSKEFDTILRRLFLLLLDASDDFLTGVKTNDKDLMGTIDQKHDTISKFVSYCLRIFNQGKYKNNNKDAFFMYHIIANLDNVTDILKYSSRKILSYNKKMNKDSVDIIEKIFKSWKTYYEIFYKYDIKKILFLSKQRDDIKENIMSLAKNKKIPYEEVLILEDLENSLELLLDMTEAKLSIVN